MSLKMQFDSTSEVGVPFTGFSSLTGRRCVFRPSSSLRSKARAGHRSARMQPWSSKEDRAVWPLQLHDVDRVFQVLRRGLREILESQQGEMDFLLTQQRDTKRDSRLAFLYDLEKEIRAQERYIRRVEFQLSKVEELYETYCLQWRLCQGVVNMKKAFSASPPSRGCRESLLELGRSHRHSLQDILEMERELEILLGELHIKMKGLIGFARLCPGDQYEVTLQLGRQRWRIRGRIKSDDTQSWEEEYMVFLPHTRHNFEIKVMELKGLSWLLVGMVTCASADFLVSKPQLVLVDITELGTMKIKLEIAWNPFESGEKMKRPSASARKNPLYSQTAGRSPSFTEKYFLSVARQLQDADSISAALKSESRHDASSASLLAYPFNVSDAVFSSGCSPQDTLRKNQAAEAEPEEHHADQDMNVTQVIFNVHFLKNPAGGSKSTLFLITRSHYAHVLHLLQLSSSSSSSQDSCEPHSFPDLPALTIPPAAAPPEASGDQQHGAPALQLGAQISELRGLLRNQPSSEAELRALEHNLLHLATVLKNDLSLLRGSSPADTLGLEEALESFDFLSQDFNADDDDASCLRGLRKPEHRSNDVSSFQELENAPLTSGNGDLDQTLGIHLDVCCILLQAIRESDFRPSRRELLQEAALQADVLQRVGHLLLEKNSVSATDILPQVQRSREVLLFWDACVADSSSPFLCDADSFFTTLRKSFTHKVKAKQPGQAAAVFSRLLKELQAVCDALPHLRPVCRPDIVTLFQLSVYLRRWSSRDLGAHITRLSKEESTSSQLVRSPKRRRTVNKLSGQLMAELLPLGCTLQTLAALQVDPNHRVSKAACKCLCRAAGVQSFRNKVNLDANMVVSEANLGVSEGNLGVSVMNLEATESVEHIIDVWRSTDEALRAAVRETVLSFGKRGFQAFQRMEQLRSDMEEAAHRNQETVITIL
uniref:RIPOR family member 3 n=1 Tax=Tetraodon nigroviridis TaxID=99883 RepID=H3DJD6_TETNG